MSSPWPLERLGDLVAKIGSGATPRGGKDVYIEQGTAFIRSQNVYDNKFSFDGLVYISDDAAHDLKGVSVQAGDVLICITGESVTRTCLVDPAALPARVSQHVAIIRTDPELLDNRYLKAALLSPKAKTLLNRLSEAGATRRALTKAHLEALEIPLPPLSEQRRIAGVLGALDDLIETNQRLADSCAGLRRALVRRALALCDEAVPLSSVARFVNGRNFTKGASSRGLPVIRTPEIRRGPDASTVRSDVAAEQDFRASAGDILFVWSGSLMVERWLYEEGLVNQHIFKVTPEPGCPSWLVFALIEHQMPWFLGLAADKATTMGHIQRGHLDALVPWPGDAAIRELAQTVEPLWDQELALRIEMQQLAHTRDELLPLLLSGRVSVREVAA